MFQMSILSRNAGRNCYNVLQPGIQAKKGVRETRKKGVTGKRIAGLENPAFSLNGNHAYEKVRVAGCKLRTL